ncbi:MAG: GMC family oxidoreductase [Planctomycetes bacterium]|nr:GMC family oxidoreductase [Planctomycetota bacterium]
MSTPIEFDALVVGSGAAGGWAAKELCERGLRTLLLEAGRTLDPARDFPPPPAKDTSKLQVWTRGRAFLEGQGMQARCMSFSRMTRHLFVNDRENPYTTERGAPFNWYRGRQLGGRMHLWGRNALRIGDSELHPQDGASGGWPIAYADLEPWYEKVERFLGVHGSAAGIASIPDGVYDQPLPLTGIERRILATLAMSWRERPATTCRIVRHTTDRRTLPVAAALATGKLTLRSLAAVSRVLVDAQGRASGVEFVDVETRERHEARAQVVVLAASTIETLRILLNSRSAEHPAGLGNSSGLLGRALTDHVMVFNAGPAPVEGAPRTDPYDFGSQSGLYIPSFRNAHGRSDAPFRRGYSILGSVGRIEPGWFFMAVGEMLPNLDNRVTSDPKVVDALGIPVARVRCVHGSNEAAMVRDMQATLLELASTCGLEVDHLRRESFLAKLVHGATRRMVYTPGGALLPGSAVHEAGGAPMGASASDSVVDAHNRLWDSPNVLVTDSACFPTSPFQNPGLTIMALSARAAHAAADSLGA